MDMKSAIVNVYTNYFGFTGRAARAEFWYFVLFTWIAYLLLSIVNSFVFGMNAADIDPANMDGMGMASLWGIGILGGLFWLASVIPSIAVSIRRLHDIGRTGWWLLLIFVPLGGFVLLYFYIKPSQPGANQYGPNPYGE